MTPVKQLFSQLYTDYMKGTILLSFLEAVIVFVAVRILTSLISTTNTLPNFLDVTSDVWLPLLAGVVAFAYFASRRTSKYDILKVEHAVPGLSGMLSTLKDSLGQDNVVVQAFRHDVIKQAHKASSERLVEVGRIVRRIVAIFV